MKDSFEMSLALHCAPTLAGLKPANLFHWGGNPRNLSVWSRKLVSHGLSLRSLKRCPDGGCLLYLYRVQWLSRILAEPDNAAFLRECGYPCGASAETSLRRLSERLDGNGTFPHEIGVFLGYPLEDVRGFIENGGRNYTCCGCWKSYGDPETARRQFDRYRRCTEIYCKNLRMGVALEELITA